MYCAATWLRSAGRPIHASDNDHAFKREVIMQDKNTPFDLCRANTMFMLRLTALTQESRQRARQLESQAADNALAMLRSAVETVESASDWNALTGLPAHMAHEHVQLLTKFWESWLAIAQQNGSLLQSGIEAALKQWQAETGLDVAGAALKAPAKPTLPANWPSMLNLTPPPEFAAQFERFTKALTDAWLPAMQAAASGSGVAASAPATAKGNGSATAKRSGAGKEQDHAE
jgi:hypothetical protein